MVSKLSAHKKKAPGSTSMRQVLADASPSDYLSLRFRIQQRLSSHALICGRGRLAKGDPAVREREELGFFKRVG
jgi:hypothetical protein